MVDTQQFDDSSARSQTNSVGLCVSLLGTFTIWLGAHEIVPDAFPRPKALQLFKLVVLQVDHQLHRDQVIDFLWPHLTLRSANSQLYKAIHYVRQALATASPPCPPDTLLELRDEVIRLSAPDGVHTDVGAFEQLARAAAQSGELRCLRQAVTCYKGDLLPADRYEEWTLTSREMLRERFIELLLALGQRCLKAGRLAEAADAFRQALEQDKVREPAHRGLMRVYALQGSRARALRQYHRCVEMLAQGLGVDPSPETITLHEAVLNNRIRPIQSRPTLPAIAPPALPPLVGRQAERRTLERMLQQLEQGQGAILTIEGPAGMGKTRLAQEMLRADDRQWMVLWGSTYEQEGQSPYSPFIAALRQAVRIDPAAAHLIPAELAVAIPELPGDVAPVATADRVTAQSALFAGVLRFLAARAERTPVVLILDDLHAADSGTYKLFHYLARQTPSLPLLLVGIWRTDEPGRNGAQRRPGDSRHLPADLEQVISSLDRRGLVQRFVLAPLAAKEQAHLLEQTLDGGFVDRAVAKELYRLAAGNPLFAKAMVRQLVTDQKIALVENRWQFTTGDEQENEPVSHSVPPSLQTLVGNRLKALSRPALRMLQFAAVAGLEIPLSLLEAWSDLDGRRVVEPSLLNVLDDAVVAGLLQERGFNYHFAHPLYRQAIYQGMSGARRRALHGQAAAGLEQAYQHDPAALPVEAVAFHYLQAGDVWRAVSNLTRAGDRAESLFDHESAIQRYQEALSLLQECRPQGSEHSQAELFERIGDVHRATGQISSGLEAYRQGLALLSETEPDFRRTLHRKITHATVVLPDLQTAVEHLKQAWALLREDGLERARLLISQALFDWNSNDPEAAIEHALQALEIAEQKEATIEINQACEMLAVSYLPLGRWEEGLHYELRRQASDWSPDIIVSIDAHLCLYQYRLQGVESFQQARHFIEKVAQQTATMGNLRCLAVCYYVLGSLALWQGETETAGDSLAKALDLNRRIGASAGAAYTLARQVELLTVAGDPHSAWERVQAGLEMTEQAAIRNHCLMMTHTAGIWNRLAVSDLTGAAELVEAARQHDAHIVPCAVCSVDKHAAVAAYYVAAGDLDLAAQYTQQALQLAQYAQNRLGEARALRVQGQIHVAQGRIAHAETCLAKAAAAFRDLEDRYDLARTYQIWADIPVTAQSSAEERHAMRQEAQQLLTLFITL